MEGYVKGHIILCTKPEEAANGDAVISVTVAKDGFIKNEWIKPGTIFFFQWALTRNVIMKLY